MLLAKRELVRILVRPQSNYQSLIDAGAQAVLGDLKQPAQLQAIWDGVDTVITTANAARRGGEDTPQTVDQEGNQNLIDAARGAGVKQFIFVSALPANPDSPVPLLRAKGLTEAYLQTSGLPYTILAPDGYMEVFVAGVVGMPALMGQPVIIVGGGRRKHSFISMQDVAKFILASIRNPSAINQKILLGGPQPLSLRDTVAIYERVLGHQIQVRSIAPGEVVPGVDPMVLQLIGSVDTYDSPIDMIHTANSFGIQLTPLEEVARLAVRNAEQV
jgi:NADH dehydrogenase